MARQLRRTRAMRRWALAALAIMLLADLACAQSLDAPKVKELYQAARKEGQGRHLGHSPARGRVDSGGVRKILPRHRRAVSRRQRYRGQSDRRGARRPPSGRCLSEFADRDLAGAAARSARPGRLVAVQPRRAQHRLRRQDGLHQQHRLHRRLQHQAGRRSRCSKKLDRQPRRALSRQGRIELVPAAAAHRRTGPGVGGGEGAAIRARHRWQDEFAADAGAAQISAAVG